MYFSVITSIPCLLRFTSLSLALSVPTNSVTTQPIPLIIWHGLGDTYDAPGLNATAALAATINPSTPVYIIRLSNDSSLDRRATFFGNLTTQLSSVCDALRSHPTLSLARAVNALGFSQGGQFLRAYVERCNDPPVRSLVTFGSQHNGIARFQGCAPTDWLCRGAEGLLGANTWSALAQGGLVPAQYFRDPEDLEPYLEKSNFLADVNNERPGKRNNTYRRNLAGLRRFVMFVFEEDQTVVPKESGWFSEVNATTGMVTGLRHRAMYKEDWLGLRHLDEKGGLVFRTAPGKHMELSDKLLKETFRDFFAPEKEEVSTVENGWWSAKDKTQEMVQHVEEIWIDL